MATEIEIAQAVAKAISEKNSGLNLKDVGIFFGTIGGAFIAFFTLYFNNKINERENSRLRRKDEVELQIKIDTNKRENDTYESIMAKARTDIDFEKNAMIQSFNSKMKNEQRDATKYFKNLRQQYNDIVYDSNKLVAGIAKSDSITESDIYKFYDCVETMRNF